MATTPPATVRELYPDQRPRARLVDVDPTRLVFGPNARTTVAPDPELRASIRQLGVLQPIVCYATGDELVVLYGQRRTLAAIQERLPLVPVVMLPLGPGDVDRIFGQLAENDHRAELDTADHVHAFQQLAMLGLPASVIATRSARRRDIVDAALAVAASAVAATAVDEHPALTLDAAAAVAEFADDPAVVEEITAAADTGASVQHVVQRARDARRDTETRAAAADQLRAAGTTVLDDWPTGAASLPRLGLTDAQHRDCPGHAAMLTLDHTANVDGHHEPAWRPIWLCQNPARHRPDTSQLALDQAERDAARQRRQQLNAEWSSATTVRRGWLRDLAHRRTPPPGAEQFIAHAVLLHDAWPGGTDEHALARHLIGVAGDTPRDQLDAIAELARTTPRRATLITLVLLLATWEDRTTVHTWQSPIDRDRRYMQALIDWGYPAAPIERRLLGSDDGADL